MLFNLRHTALALSIAAAFFTLACQQGTAPTTANMNNTNTVGNVNTNATNFNSNNTNYNTNGNMSSSTSNTMGDAANAREPQTYQAVLTFSGQATNQQGNTGTPAMSAQIARDGDNRRIATKFLGLNEEIVLLDKDGKRYLVLPSRKQYAELSPESIGVIVPAIPTPAQIVTQLQRQPGYERVGEEELLGRQVTKYRYTRSGNTGTPAGEAQGEAFVFVDNQTGLPLRAELNAQSSSNVRGFSGARGQLEMRDITTNVNPNTFDIPQGYTQITPEQLRGQLQQLMQIATAVIGMMGNMANPNANPTPMQQMQPSPVPQQR